MISFHPGSRENPYRGAIAKDFVVYSGSELPILCRIMRTYSWSPIVWSQGRRLKTHFLRADYYGLDYDKSHDDEGNPVNIEVISRKFCDCWHIIGTTKSHQKQKGSEPPCDRFRVLLKAERPITSAAEYEHNVRLLADDTGADPACVDGARFFFRCDQIVGMNTAADAHVWQVEAPMGDEERQEMVRRYLAACQRYAARGCLPPFATRFLTTVIPGNSLHRERFLYGCQVARCGVTFEDAMRRMLAAPSFRSKTITPKLLAEYERVMRDAYRAVAIELEKKTPA